ncbi:MAG: intracellular growth attenuator family protein [Pseudomonadales bacterium]|nr:intracellular growth attenuator family protein [Pseudomonadales bacterium]
MEALAVLKILLILFVLGYTLYSVIVYQGRKTLSRKDLTAFRREATPLRKLDSVEQRLLDTVMAEADSKTTGKLSSNEVYSLTGPYRRHGLETNGNTVWHDTIGGVEVLLPYDAQYFLREHNEALVVLADKQAIVIALNDEFHLAGGEERDQRREQKQAQWESGASGALSQVFQDDESRDDAPNDSLTIRAQRDETDAEIEARRGRGIALLPACLWTLAFFSLWIAMGRETPLFLSLWLLVALASASLALYNFFRRRQASAPEKVNEVAGQIRLVPVAVDEHNNVQVSVTLSESIGFQLPEHWRPFIQYEDGQNQDMAVRVDDYSVVRYGTRMSLDEEIRRFPPVYWGRHLTLAIVGAIAILFPLASVTQLSRDVLLTTGWLTDSPQHFQTPQALQDAPPSPGTLVTIEGQGHCDINASSASSSNIITTGQSPFIDCQRIHWGGRLLQSGQQETPANIQRLQDESLFETREDSYLTLVATMNGWDPYENGMPVMLNHLPALISALDDVCNGENPGRETRNRCHRIHRLMLDKMIFTMDPTPESWAMLKEGVLQRQDSEKPVHALTSDRTALLLKGYVQRLVTSLEADRSAMAARDMAAHQQGEVVIDIVQGTPPNAWQGQDNHQTPLKERLARMLAHPEGQAFTLEGMVTAYRTDETGTPELAIDLTRNSQTVVLPLLNILWLLAAAGLLVGHGILAIIRYQQSRQRHRDVNALYA